MDRFVQIFEPDAKKRSPFFCRLTGTLIGAKNVRVPNDNGADHSWLYL